MFRFTSNSRRPILVKSKFGRSVKAQKAVKETFIEKTFSLESF